MAIKYNRSKRVSWYSLVFGDAEEDEIYHQPQYERYSPYGYIEVINKNQNEREYEKIQDPEYEKEFNFDVYWNEKMRRQKESQAVSAG